MNRFYCKNIKNGYIDLGLPESRHIIHVMRMAKGAAIELFDGRGMTAEAVIAKTTRKTATVEVKNTAFTAPRQTGRVIIASAVAKGQRFDWMISKCTELGVDFIVPLIFERSVKYSSGNSAVERYKKLAVSASKQCGRLILPEIISPVKFELAIEQLKNKFPDAILIFGGFGEDTVAINDLADKKSDFVVFIGPEGGMTPKEEEKLINFGAVNTKITNTVLRTETASIAFAAVLCASRDVFAV